MALGSNLALLGIGRLNAFRLNYLPPALKAIRDNTLTITLGGAPLRVRLDSLTIHDVINDAPNTASFIVDNATPPTTGQRLKIVLGVDPKYQLFIGTLQAADATWKGRASIGKREWVCEAIDDTNRADWLRPFGAWEGVSATTIAQQLVATFAPGYTSAHVQAGLAPVTLYLDGTERMNGALALIAKLIGGYYYWEDFDLHLFVGDEPGVPKPDDITGAPGQLLDDPSMRYVVDDAQIRTRCYGKGHSEATLAAVNAGDTLIPIANAVMFTAGGGRAISEWQRLTYTGTVLGGGGALVGPGVTPSAPVTLANTDGAGVTAGAHSYAYTWQTAAGETPPAPAAAITVSGALAAPAASFSVSSGVQLGGPPAGTVMDYRLYIQDAVGNLSPPAPGVRITSTGYRPVINFVTTADMAGRYVAIYRNDNNGQGWAPIAAQGTVPGYSTPYPPNQPAGYGQQWTDVTVSFSGGAGSAPAGGTATAGRVVVSGISTGPSGVTARKLYRSAAGTATPLKFLATIADNTTTSYTDAIADASLGAAAPATDTSGLQMPAGQVLPGAAALPVSGTGWALPGGGWAIIGNGAQVIRYTGITGNQITGIPATGTGAISAAVNYNSTVTGAPMLTGVAGLGASLIAGAPVNIWVQVDDTAAQAAYATRVGGTGIVEHLIQDERRGEPSLQAICTADLVLYSYATVTVQYACFDPKTRSGKIVHVSLPALLLDAIPMIQDVTIDRFQPGPHPPRFTVTASNIRVRFEDLLRRLAGTLEEGF